MIYGYPTIIVDNFFKYPQDVRELALTMEYSPSDTGTYSGVRTKSLHTTHPNFFRHVCQKILDCYSVECVEYSAYMHFHLTGQEFGSGGWVHVDADRRFDSALASIIYLNIDNNDIDNGTCLYKIKNLDRGDENMTLMKRSYIDSVDNQGAKALHNADYEATVKMGNTFNRMVGYDPRNPHSGSNYYGNNKETSRLTLLVFFNKIVTPDNYSPLHRAHLNSSV
jgi:hypothetical protein